MANQEQSSGSGEQGFASMDEDKQREIASKGGKTSHAEETEDSADDVDDAADVDDIEEGEDVDGAADVVAVEEDEDVDDAADVDDVEASEEREPASGSGQQGFASMDPDKQREIASMGGKEAHERGTAHEFSAEEAREAGRKGGQS